MQCAVCVALRYVGGGYALDVGRQRLDVGDNRYLDERMARVIRLKLVAALDRAEFLRGVNLD